MERPKNDVQGLYEFCRINLLVKTTNGLTLIPLYCEILAHCMDKGRGAPTAVFRLIADSQSLRSLT